MLCTQSIMDQVTWNKGFILVPCLVDLGGWGTVILQDLSLQEMLHLRIKTIVTLENLM